MAWWGKLRGRTKDSARPADPVIAAPVRTDPLDLPPAFASLPAVAEMAAHLRRLAQGERTAVRVLHNLARSSGLPLAQRLEPQRTRALQLGGVQRQCLDELTRDASTRIHRETLAAFCLLIDLKSGLLDADSLVQAVEREEPVSFSKASLQTVVELFGQTLPPSAAALPEGTADPDALSGLERLRAGRAALDVLEDLSLDSGSARTFAYAQALRERLPAGHFRVNDEQLALLPLLESAGYRVNPHTLMALCLFVDIETGNICKQNLDRIAEAADTFDSSMYSMVAAAGAFGLELNGYVVEDPLEADPLETLSGLASAAPAGVLACFRKRGESGRWWERLQGLDDCRHTLSLGLEFTGLVLSAPVDSERLRPLPDQSLLGRTDVLSREHMVLRWLRDSVDGVIHREPGTISLRSDAELQARLLSVLREAAGDVRGLIADSTLEGLIEVLQRDSSIDLLLIRPLVEALRAGAPADWIALRVLSALCEEDRVHVPGGLKQYDLPRLWARSSSADARQVSSAVPLHRQLAVQLLVTREQLPKTGARQLLEYHLHAGLEDPDPGVARAAVEGLVRLTMADQLPLPALLQPIPNRFAASELSKLEVERLAPLMRELELWLAQQKEKDDLFPLGLPFTDKEGKIVPEHARPWLELLASLEQASQADSSRRRHRYYCLLPGPELRAMGDAILWTWAELAKRLSRSLEELTGLVPRELMMEYRLLLAELMEGDPPRRPFLGGESRKVTIHHFAPYWTCGVFMIEPVPAGSPLEWRSPMFEELVELGRRIDLRDVFLLRLTGSPEEPLTGLDTMDPVFTTRKILTPRQLELLQVHQARFVPLLSQLPPMLSGDSPASEAMWALLDLYQYGEGAPGWQSYRRSRHGRPASPRTREPAWEEIAPALAERFRLGKEHIPRLERVLRPPGVVAVNRDSSRQRDPAAERAEPAE
ncbi:MAG: hypothetical protein HY319_28415 [Armatimonadetes bacterium]|nr:hypothetical protein [Armatimonadota bacterium]